MKNQFLPVFLSLLFSGLNGLLAQCPRPLGEQLNGQLFDTLCPEQTFSLRISETLSRDLPNGGRLEWYYHSSPNFRPDTLGTFLGQVPITITNSIPTRSCGTLEAGDLAFLAYRATDPDAFAFVPLVNLAPNTQIFFTDYGFRANGTFRNQGEGIISWTAPAAGVAAGTVITVQTLTQQGGNGSPNLTYGDNVGSTIVPLPNHLNFQLATAGDQIFAYCGTINTDGSLTGTLLAGIHWNGATWNSDATDSQTSTLPTSLTAGQTAVAFAAQSNGRFNCSGGTLSGTAQQIAQNINTPTNWTRNATPFNPTANPCTFNISSSLIAIVPPLDTQLSAAFCNQTLYLRGLIVQPISIGCNVDSLTTTQVLTLRIQCPDANFTAPTSVCAGTNLNLTASAAPNQTYLWTTGETTSSISLTPNSNQNLGLTVTDALGCTATQTRNLTVFAQPTARINGPDTVCVNQPFTLIPSGDQTYLWSDGSTADSLTLQIASNQTVGLTVTDLNGCTATTSRDLVAASQPSLNLTAVPRLVCVGDSVTVQISGANTYTWEDGRTTALIGDRLFADQTYRVTGSLGAGCTATATLTVRVGAFPTVTLAGISPLCANSTDGTINTTVTSSTGRFGYQWNTGATTAILPNLAAGLYNLAVTDTLILGMDTLVCTTRDTLDLLAPPALRFDDTLRSNVSCSGLADGRLSVLASGGVAPYAYAWSNGQGQIQLQNLPAGFYTLTLTDANGCTLRAQNLEITEPDLLLIGIDTLLPAGCTAGANFGLIVLAPQGGTQPYSFVWANGNTTNRLDNLTAGNYALTLSDANNCTNTLSIEVPLGGLSLAVTELLDTVCSNGTEGRVRVAVQPLAGTTLAWSNGATTSDLENLSAGTYTLFATNTRNGQTCEDSLTIQIFGPPNLHQLALRLDQPLPCDASPQAVVVAEAQGGWLPTTYVWENGSTNATRTGLAEGVYFVTATDSRGCVLRSGGFLVEAPELPDFEAFIGSRGTREVEVTRGTNLSFGAFSNQTLVWSWSPVAGLSNPNQVNPSLTVQDSGVYVLTGRLGLCLATDTVRVRLRPDFLGMPTAFSPNGDGQNDVFRPIQLDPSFIKTFRVFNRWGQVVYNDANLSGGGWNGELNGVLQSPDVYLYVLEYQTPSDAEPQLIRGEVTLMR